MSPHNNSHLSASAQAPNKLFPVAPPAFLLHISTNGADLQDLLDFAVAIQDERKAEKMFVEMRAWRSQIEAKLFQGQLPNAVKHLEQACCGSTFVTRMVEDLGIEVNIPRSCISSQFLGRHMTSQTLPAKIDALTWLGLWPLSMNVKRKWGCVLRMAVEAAAWFTSKFYTNEIAYPANQNDFSFIMAGEGLGLIILDFINGGLLDVSES
ncbi:hypothetical protein SERLA73DRAFT_150225 [Serpula lacrymans var. lacrymans S7.3]|uniref:Uncharacterized protein n=1 Tax=Serpula lacrymans var. lacrymans (strain S7.3) TaxID=936435 RepID=F8PLL3_SERL3|nr:hypothetical protein SERLA73DRAFT_150225 [Serpula lacrymans var. lacrymans S7.3]